MRPRTIAAQRIPPGTLAKKLDHEQRHAMAGMSIMPTMPCSMKPIAPVNSGGSSEVSTDSVSELPSATQP